MRPKESGAAKAVNLQRENMEKKASFFLPRTTRSKKAATFFVPRTTHSKAAGTPPAHPLLIAGAGGAGAGLADINVMVQNEKDEAEAVDARENEDELDEAEAAQRTVDSGRPRCELHPCEQHCVWSACLPVRQGGCDS